MDEDPQTLMAEALDTLVTEFISYATQVFQLVLPTIKQWYDTVYGHYLEAGAPYGETQEGCLRWMEDLAKVQQMEMEIERIISHHQGLAYLHKRLAEKRVQESEQ